MQAGSQHLRRTRRRYVDFPITDVLQMMGRAGRPQYDQHGVAVIMVADAKKSFYKKARSMGRPQNVAPANKCKRAPCSGCMTWPCSVLVRSDHSVP